MKLTELEPQFIRYARVERAAHLVDVDTLGEAQGIRFNCPQPGHGHSIICWFANRGVPDGASPEGYRWPASGSGYADLSLTPSILFEGDWHGYITNGEVTTC